MVISARFCTKKNGILFKAQCFLVIREEPDNEPAVFFESFLIIC